MKGLDLYSDDGLWCWRLEDRDSYEMRVRENSPWHTIHFAAPPQGLDVMFSQEAARIQGARLLELANKADVLTFGDWDLVERASLQLMEAYDLRKYRPYA